MYWWGIVTLHFLSYGFFFLSILIQEGMLRSGEEAASLRETSPPDPLSRRVAGNKLDASFGVARPCEMGAVPCNLVVVTAADRAAATYAAQRTRKISQ